MRSNDNNPSTNVKKLQKVEGILSNGEILTVRLPSGGRLVGPVIERLRDGGPSTFRYYGEYHPPLKTNKPWIMKQGDHKILRDKSEDWRERREVLNYEDNLFRLEYARAYIAYMIFAGTFVPKEVVETRKPKVHFPAQWTKDKRR